MARPRRSEAVRGSRPRGDGRWWAYYYDSRGRQRYVYGATADERDTRLREALNLRDAGVAPARGTLGAYVDHWAGQLEVRPDRYAPATVINYRYHLSLVPAWLRLRQLIDVTPEDVDDVIAALLAEGRATGTVSRVRHMLVTVLAQAQRRGHVPRNVAALSNTVRRSEQSPEPLNPEEARALLATLRGHRLASLYLTALSCGLRQSETIGQIWPNVDLDQETLTVNRQITRERDLRAPKAGSVRTVVLPTVCVVSLREHWERQQFEKRRLRDAWQDQGLVWPDEAGAPLQHQRVYRTLRRLCRQAGIPEVSFHALRHSAATLLLVQGVPSRVIMDVLGHQEMVRYQHVLPELRREAAEAMDRLLNVSLSDGLSKDVSDREMGR